MKYLDGIFQDLGFGGMSEFMQSFAILKGIGTVSIAAILAGMSVFSENYFGVSLVLLIAFVVLICVEFYTGIAASIKEGQKIQSKKWGRMFVKVSIYVMILGALHALRGESVNLEVIGVDKELDIYGFAYYLFYHGVILQFLISIFENLDRMGYKEARFIRIVLNNKYIRKYLNLNSDEEPK